MTDNLGKNISNKSVLILLCGAPGSGKSTWGKKFAAEKGLKYLSSDEARAKFGKSEEDQSVTPMVFSYLQRVVDQLLEQGKSVMVDATNMNKKDRKSFIEAADKYGAYKIAVVFERDKVILKKQVAPCLSGCFSRPQRTAIRTGEGRGSGTTPSVLLKQPDKQESPKESHQVVEIYQILYLTKCWQSISVLMR